jgi:prepilin-type processing-associated H-X9-DG protein
MILTKKTAGAFTLIEVATVVAVIAVLIALLLVAVQLAREAARRGQCTNNLHQLSIALSAYESLHNAYPMSNNGSGFSPFVMELPFLEQANIYNAINFSARVTGDATPQNSTVARIQLAVLLCPSDPLASISGEGKTDYAGNRGVGYGQTSQLNNGLFNQPLVSTQISPANILDGLSQTAAFAEWRSGFSGSSRGDAALGVYATSGYPSPDQFDQFARACELAQIPLPITTGKGVYWMHGDLRSSLYNHDISIGGHSCINGTRIQKSAWTSGSAHPGGAGVAFVDGHVSFMANATNRLTWMALGTRAGSEVVQESGF